MKLDGHAGYAAAGSDIVCAAESALAYTLAASVMRFGAQGGLEDEPVLRFEPGDIEIRCKPKADYRSAVELLYEHTMGGYQMLQNSYPDNVAVSMFGLGDQP